MARLIADRRKAKNKLPVGRCPLIAFPILPFY